MLFGAPCLAGSFLIRKKLPETRGKELKHTIAELRQEIVGTAKMAQHIASVPKHANIRPILHRPIKFEKASYATSRGTGE